MSSVPPHNYGDPQTRTRILDVARASLVERGSSLRLSDIARDAAVSRQALYLHFGDRDGLLLALVRHIDETLGLSEDLDRVLAARSGRELLEQATRLSADFWEEVAPVAMILTRSPEDGALHTAWRDRMAFRRSAFQRMADRLEELGELDAPWAVEDAGDLLYATTHFDSWAELTRELGWSTDRYVQTLSRLLARALLQS